MNSWPWVKMPDRPDSLGQGSGIAWELKVL
jgi:hypothetical protein